MKRREMEENFCNAGERWDERGSTELTWLELVAGEKI